MAYNNEHAEPSALVFDCETVAIEGAGEYLEPASAPANYKNPDAIAAYIENANREALGKAALDIDLGRIVALGVLVDGAGQPIVRLAPTEDEEADTLRWFWSLVTQSGTFRPTLIGFNCLAYDLPLMVRRSLYLGVTAPSLRMGKYRHEGIEDLMMALSFDGAVRYRGLSFYCKRFGIDVPDDSTGKDIAGMVAAGEWAGVEAHCAADVLKTAKLAERVGVLTPREMVIL